MIKNPPYAERLRWFFNCEGVDGFEGEYEIRRTPRTLFGIVFPSSFLISLQIFLYDAKPMKSVNKVTLLGNATRDPELKSTSNGLAVCTFGIATNRVWKDEDGEKKTLPEFHNLVAWGPLADFVHTHVRKGHPIYVEGYLKTRSWDSQEGAKIFRTEVVADNVILLEKKEDAQPKIDSVQESVDVAI